MHKLTCLAVMTIGLFAAQAADVAPPAAPAGETAELAKPDADGWIQLFNGKDFTGWYGDPTVWRIVDGYISGKTDKQAYNTFLIFNRPFSDFVLDAKLYLVDKKGNSGIQIRSKVENKEKWIVGGYQPDIGGPEWWGSLYEEHGRGVLLKSKGVASTIKGDDWNTMVITADGPKIKIETNGVLGTDYEEKDSVKGAKEGIIALQYHAPGAFEVRYKDIRIKLLNTEKK